MATNTIDKILDKFPYSDGSFRRRMVAGGILVVFIFVMNFNQLSIIFSGINFNNLLTSPFLVMIIFVLIYAVGNIIELLGEIFLVRAASGVLWAISFPKRISERGKNIYKKIGLIIIGIFWLPFLIIINVLKGFIGHTYFKIQLRSSLGYEANIFYSSLPDKVAMGLSEPVGDNAEIAWKYLVDQFTTEADQRWARRFIGRTKDVLAITTSIIIIIIIISIFSVYNFINITTEIDEKYGEYKEQINISRSLAIKLKQEIAEVEIQLKLTDSKEDHKNLEKIKADLLEKSGVLKSEFEALQKETNLYLTEGSKAQYKRTIILAMTTIAILIPIMFLYIGFFITLRNSIVSILEVLSLKRLTP